MWAWSERAGTSPLDRPQPQGVQQSLGSGSVTCFLHPITSHGINNYGIGSVSGGSGPSAMTPRSPPTSGPQVSPQFQPHPQWPTFIQHLLSKHLILSTTWWGGDAYHHLQFLLGVFSQLACPDLPLYLCFQFNEWFQQLVCSFSIVVVIYDHLVP